LSGMVSDSKIVSDAENTGNALRCDFSEILISLGRHNAGEGKVAVLYDDMDGRNCLEPIAIQSRLRINGPVRCPSNVVIVRRYANAGALNVSKFQAS
jgi:hypothetical protein